MVGWQLQRYPRSRVAHIKFVIIGVKYSDLATSWNLSTTSYSELDIESVQDTPNSAFSLLKMTNRHNVKGLRSGFIQVRDVFGSDSHSSTNVLTTRPTSNNAKEQTSRQEHQMNKARGSDLTNTAVPPYTSEEKQWLKQRSRGEFHFLLEYGLNIYKEEHREEGRRIARALMESEYDEEYEEDEEYREPRQHGERQEYGMPIQYKEDQARIDCEEYDEVRRYEETHANRDIETDEYCQGDDEYLQYEDNYTPDGALELEDQACEWYGADEGDEQQDTFDEYDAFDDYGGCEDYGEYEDYEEF